MTGIDDAGREQMARHVAVRRVGATGADDVVATEEPLEIRLGYSRRDGSRAEENVSVTMRTPGHDEDLAVGFLFTEGIIHSRADVQSVVPRGQPAPNGLTNVVRVELTPGVTVDFKRLERHFYTTFHHPFSGANVVTTDNSDWATNCPEYKVTAVQASKVTRLSDWQQKFAKFTEEQLEYLKRARQPEKVS